MIADDDVTYHDASDECHDDDGDDDVMMMVMVKMDKVQPNNVVDE